MKTRFGCRLAAVAVLGVGVLCGGTAQAQTLRVVVRAFIPKEHPSNPGYAIAIPGQPGKTMLPAPAPANACFDTDQRTFSNAPDASARLTTDLTVNLAASPATVKATGAALHRAGVTVRRNCATGAVTAQNTAGVDKCHIGQPAEADGKVQVVFECHGSNPVVPVVPNWLVPDIDYSVKLTYDRAAKTVSLQSTVGAFPSFEAYASLNGKPLQKVFQLDPAAGSTVKDLFDAGLGLSDRPVAGNPVKLN